MSDFVVGLDLGQATDYPAVAVVERVAQGLHCRHLHRFALGTLYPSIVDTVQTMLASPQLQGAPLVVDATGVGRAVVDMFRQKGMRPQPVTITAGDSVSQQDGFWRVPKRDLVAAVVAPLQEGRLKFAEGMHLAPTLIDEMLKFEVKITPASNDVYGAWREGAHDDLLLAVMLAAWWANRPIVPGILIQGKAKGWV